MNIELVTMQIQHAKDIAELLNDSLVQKYLSSVIPFPYTEKDAQDFISLVRQDGSAVKSKTVLCDGKIAGVAGFQVKDAIDRHHVAVCGYWLGKKYWGQGIGTKVLSLVLKDAFANQEIIRAEATAFSQNEVSVMVMQKNGMSFEGKMRDSIFKGGKTYDEGMFGITKKEYDKRNK